MKSDHCYVIGGGPSLIGFDFDALPKGFRIGANRAAWLAKCDVLCTIDRKFHTAEKERIAAFGANAHVALTYPHETIPGATYWHYTPYTLGLALAPHAISGANSGFAALNLAVHLGFKDIALLGFDMKWENRRSHFHEGYGQRFGVDRALAVWATHFDHVPRQLERKGVTVTNFIGPLGSRVKAFPTAPLADLL